MRKVFFFFIILFLISAYATGCVAAQNSDYNLNIDHVEIQGGINDAAPPTSLPAFLPTPPPSPATLSPSSLLPKPAGIGLTLSTTQLDFGKITATNPSARQLSFTAATDNPHGLSLLIQENHELQSNTTKAIIPDTSCDTGRCTMDKAELWTNPLTYGLGYTCAGSGCADDFGNDLFRPFPSETTSGERFSRFGGEETAGSLNSTLQIKVNVSATTPASSFSNTVFIISVANL